MRRRTAHTQHRIWAGLAALSLTFSFASLYATPPASNLRYLCSEVGEDCPRTIVDPINGSPVRISTSIMVPEGQCDFVEHVAVEIESDHAWVGDLRATLSHNATKKSAALLDRPGLGAIGDFGCPGIGIDATFSDSAIEPRGDDLCAATIPAIDGAVHSSRYARHLRIEPDTAPLLDGCAFELFEGDFVPNLNTTISEPAGCPMFSADEFSCLFRGGFNGGCGGDVNVFVENFNGSISLSVVDHTPATFVGQATGPYTAALESFDDGAFSQVSGDVELSDIGLEVHRGSPCAGTWTLSFQDFASPNRGRIIDWALIIDPRTTPTPTPTDTPTRTPTHTLTRTPTHTLTRTPTHSPTRTDTPSPTPSFTNTFTPTPSTPAPTATASAVATTPAGSTASPTTTPTSGSPGATPTATATSRSATPAISATATATNQTAAPATDTPTPALATETPAPATCPGDCDGDGQVMVGELIRGVRIALGLAAVGDCPSFDTDGDDEVGIGELIAAVRSALDGCPQP